MSSIENRKQHFIQKAREVHSNKYDYSEIEYVSTKRPVKIICPIHGPFTQCPGDHLKGWDVLNALASINLLEKNE
jgi:hypothetical protein